MERDPVCGITIHEKSPFKSTWLGHTYVLCCPACKIKFDREPQRYAVTSDVAPAAARQP